MTDATNEKREFFVSFNQADLAWVTWFARVLQKEAHSSWCPNRDFADIIPPNIAHAHGYSSPDLRRAIRLTSDSSGHRRAQQRRPSGLGQGLARMGRTSMSSDQRRHE